MRGRFRTEVVAPLPAKAFDLETFQASKHGGKGSVS
jgi:hypothetical protein